MFFNKRKRYNGDVAALLPAFGIDMQEAGVVKLLNVLDTAWSQSFSAYEAALLVAYSFAGGLYQHGHVQRADSLVRDRLLPVQNDWIKKGIVRAALVEPWPAKLEQRAKRARSSVASSDPVLSPSTPDVTQCPPIAIYAVESYVLLLVENARSIAERLTESEMPIAYRFVLTALDRPTMKPRMFVTLEEGLAGGSFFCTFDEDGNHVNLGPGDTFSTVEAFTEAAIAHVCRALNLDAKSVIQEAP